MAKWTKNHMLEIGAVVAILGLILTALSWTHNFTDPKPGWLGWYSNLVTREEGDYNLFLFLAGPIMLIIGGFYLGEQIVLRRRFDRMIDTPKKSEFVGRRKDLEDLAKRLPDTYGKRIRDKETEFAGTSSSRRSA